MRWMRWMLYTALLLLKLEKSKKSMYVTRARSHNCVLLLYSAAHTTKQKQ